MLVQRYIRRVLVVKQEHVDEVDKDARGSSGHKDIEGAPFEDDHEDQVSKKTQDKNHLRDELQNDVQSISEEPGGGKHTYKTEHWRNANHSPFSSKYQLLVFFFFF